jgi:hypothetical protein
MADDEFQLTAKVLVRQHYASGPEEMIKVVAEALAKAAATRPEPIGNPREHLQKEVDEAVKASALGSE